MGEERLTRAESIFQVAADLPPGERAAFLSERCGDDAGLRTLVERLLARHDHGMGSFLGQGAAAARRETDELEPARSTSDRIGPYILRDRIGAGGMGEVWRAEQTSPVRRTVALKLVKAGMDSGQVLARFEAERQALALMDHPYIAKVHDAGVTELGRPYFVMEHVAGVPITEHCDTRRLNTRERLELFEKVCEGVQHAHQKAVIHRDIKPTNVLVTDVDGKALPKIIDFGVAKATTHKLTEETMHTALGQLIGTPEYMSPEQADLTSEDVDTRTDVYSLGVVLYELLVGGLPFEPEELRKAGLEGVLKTLREKDPPRPSTKLSTLGAKTAEIAKRRRTEPRRLASQLRGDLDWIVMRALEKDRNRRYGSPRELAQDIRRHLDDQPVMAGPPGAAYRVGKFVKRNRVAVSFATMAGIGIVLALALVTAESARTAAARDEAEAVTTTLEEMLASLDPEKSGPDVTVKEMLDQTAETLGEKFAHQPLIEARLRCTVGRTYRVLGEWDAAEQHLRKALEIRSDRLGEDNPETLEAMNNLAWVFYHQHKDTDAEALAQRGLEISRRLFGEEHVQTLAAMHTLAAMRPRPGHEEEVLVRQRETLALSRRLLGKEDSQTVRAMSNLGFQCSNSGHLDEAEAVLLEALAIARRTLGNDHPVTLYVISNLGLNYWRQGRYDDAVKLQRECMETRRRVLGEEHPMTWAAGHRLAVAYRGLGQYEKAEALNRKILERRRRIRGDGHHETNRARYSLAGDLALQGRSAEAISLLRDAVDRGFRGPGYGINIQPADGLSILDDPDLASLHGDPEFEAIMEELRQSDVEDPDGFP